jgi:hypothetical protein
MIPEAHLYNYKARVYDPGLGRFLQTDPIGYASDINAYAYAGNDSINGRDPSGMDGESSPDPYVQCQNGCLPAPCGDTGTWTCGTNPDGTPNWGSPEIKVSPLLRLDFPLSYEWQFFGNGPQGGGGDNGGAVRLSRITSNLLQSTNGKPAYCSSAIYQAGAAIQNVGSAIQGVGSFGVAAGGAIAVATWFTGFGEGAGAAVAGVGAATYARGTAISEVGNGIAGLGGQSPGVTVANMISIPLKGGLLGPIVADKLIDNAKRQAGLSNPCQN